ncbi:lambda-exonuclease family protein [Pseudomonas sp. G5(2012)]|uniref:lambda-exonuclease family protein n=1 Tax=Pseudomonas sp. G5(2012) TaxID=1268068 RepID=UPI00034322AD|nr:YqaJ viral recombinase family protein [Pseudomonas sp. G5(2012)]EPA99253.1 hypothetical protein PG5_00600 [Pseudomonas sp. G5(2012)]
MNVINLRQRSPQWHTWRNEGISATSTAVILGHHPEKTRWRLWAEMTGRVASIDISMIPQVRLAIMLEPHAIAWYQDRFDTVLLPLCGQSITHPVLRASFDGVDPDNRPVEVKVLSDTNFDEVKNLGELSSHYKLYWWQVQHQMAVSGAEKGFLLFYHTRHVPIVFEILRSDLAVKLITKAALEFWALVVTDTEPEKDPLRDYFIPEGEKLAEWVKHAAEARTIDRRISELEAELKLMKSQKEEVQKGLVSLMGHHMLAEAEGVRICRYQQAGNVRWKELFASLHPDYPEDKLQSYRAPVTERSRLTIDPDTPLSDAALAHLFEAETVDLEGGVQAFCY